MQRKIGKTEACGLIILMFGEADAQKVFTQAEVNQAKQWLKSKGITFGLCHHCREPGWLYRVECKCKVKSCTKYLCGRCQRLYPPSRLKALIAYWKKEGVSIAEMLR